MGTQAERLQSITKAYREAGEPWPPTAHDLAVWALNKGHWQPHIDSVVRLVAEEFSRALREEYTVDPQGRTVRSMHAARIKRDGQQITLWDDMRTAGREFMNVGFKQRRQGIVGDCRQLNTDATSFNENYNTGKPIQISLDFTWDVAEMDAATTLRRTSNVRKRHFGQSPTAVAV